MITITITEEDRQKAQRFMNICHCIVSTAVRRVTGSDNVHGCPYSITIEDKRYKPSIYLDHKMLHKNPEATSAPFYHPEVVGLTFTLE